MPHFALKLSGVLLAATLAFTPPAQAGQTCDNKPPEAWRVQSGIALATKLHERLDASGAQVAVIARAGQDLSQYGLRFSHAGLVYRTSDAAPWTVLHKLNGCGTERSSLYRQGLGNFFLDSPHEYRALMLTLKPEVASKVLRGIELGEQNTVDQPRYSLLAYPFGLSYQNSNGWLLELLAAATAPSPPYSRAAVQARLRSTGYWPDTIHVGALERVGASVTRANVSFLDHPLHERLSGDYSTVTVESLERWLQRQDWVACRAELTL